MKIMLVVGRVNTENVDGLDTHGRGDEVDVNEDNVSRDSRVNTENVDGLDTHGRGDADTSRWFPQSQHDNKDTFLVGPVKMITTTFPCTQRGFLPNCINS
eukprot:TRINITY_DN9715_c0_g1_i8.p6 TRINITY_DN9715_c0_g1~~TRINITY_DN9715_c0_g1_i8.p6  ORF type:complete len:100 (+),score=11.71 TRINITY_DN9715_c0_g1_i8:5718-6017(+)